MNCYVLCFEVNCLLGIITELFCANFARAISHWLCRCLVPAESVSKLFFGTGRCFSECSIARKILFIEKAVLFTFFEKIYLLLFVRIFMFSELGKTENGKYHLICHFLFSGLILPAGLLCYIF